jgi:biofilm PGA synthesis protein PgaA
LDGSGTWSINDYWTIGGGGELFSRDTPLRALNAGITADAAKIEATWRQSESRSIATEGYIMPFSDGNLRTGLDSDLQQRVYVDPMFTVDELLNLSESQNSKNEARPYYNPSRDFMAETGPLVTQTLYRRYETIWEHSLQVTPGAYWEQNYGTHFAIGGMYEQRIRYNDTLDAGVGVSFNRQTYDGVYENDISILFNVKERF